MKRSTYWMVFLLAIATVLVPLEAAAQDDRAADDKTLSPYFFVEGGDPTVDRLPLKQTHVDVAVAGVIADVTVRQIYENRGTRPIHARYVFPASTRAAVYGMTMTVGNLRTVARIKERDAGRARLRGRQARGEERIAARTEPAQRVLDEGGQHHAGRHDLGGAQIHGAARPDRWRVRVRVPDGGRAALLVQERKPGVAGRRVRQGAVHPPGRGAAQRVPSRRQAVHRRAASGAGVAVPSGRHPLYRTGPRGDDAARVRPLVGQPRFHPALPVERPARSARGCCSTKAQNENFFLLMAEPPRPCSQTKCRRASTCSCSTCRDRCTAFRWTRRRS